MPQFNLTEEDTSITRADIEAMLKTKPGNRGKSDHVRQQLNGKMNKADIDKVVSDLDSYS